MFVAQAHSFTQQARLAITLAWVAGYTNALTLLTCGLATSHVSGTVSQWGIDLVQGRWDLMILTSFLLAMFLLGAMVSGLCTETGRRRGWESIYVLPMAVQAALLAGFAVLAAMHDPEALEVGSRLYAMTGIASLAMGLQNATITRISSGVVRTTHMTGVFTDLGLETIQFLYWLRDQHRNVPPASSRAIVHSARTHPTFKRLALLFSVAGSFALGAGLGTLGFVEFSKWAMLPPVAFLLWIIYQDIRLPICEIEASELVGERAMDLPDSLAVFHLRKDRQRSGKLHRLPNLLAWAERLPARTRVVILDLDEATQIDANASLELRALMQRFSATDRVLVISGVSGQRFREFKEAGAGDVLDASNVCSDLDLAIARGLALLEANGRH